VEGAYVCEQLFGQLDDDTHALSRGLVRERGEDVDGIGEVATLVQNLSCEGVRGREWVRGKR
jgi:hypothetical protein